MSDIMMPNVGIRTCQKCRKVKATNSLELYTRRIYSSSKTPVKNYYVCENCIKLMVGMIDRSISKEACE